MYSEGEGRRLGPVNQTMNDASIHFTDDKEANRMKFLTRKLLEMRRSVHSLQSFILRQGRSVFCFFFRTRGNL